MGIFGFGKKDGGFRHHIIDVIKYDGPNDVLIWKHPNEDFNTNAQLIVQEGQEAIFMKNGQALSCFPAGAYTLTTQNYPFLRALVGTVTGSVCPFTCAVFYVNKTISMGIDWGTDAPIRMNDPVYKLPINITAYGDFSVAVEDPKRLLLQLVGATSGFTQDELTQYFSGIMAKHIRSQLTGAMIQNNLSPLGIDASLDAISALIEKALGAEFVNYGLRLNHFAVANVGYSGLEKIESMLHEQTSKDIQASHEAERIRLTNRVGAENIVLQGQATAQSNMALGITELQKQGLDIARIQAANPGPIMSGNTIGLGFAPGGAAMPGFTNNMQSAAAATTETMKVIFGANGQTPMQPDSGAADAPQKPQLSFAEKVKNLQMMKEAGLLSDEALAAAIQKLQDEALGGN